MKKCPSCGNEIRIYGNAHVRFCPYCSAELPVAEPVDQLTQNQFLQIADQLTQNQFLQIADQLRHQMQSDFEEYKDTLKNLYTQLQNHRSIIKRLAAPDIVARDACHGAYRKTALELIGRVEELLGSYADAKTSPDAQQLAYDVAYFFLHGKTQIEEAGQWTMIACEHVVAPLFAYIPKEKLQQLYQMYVAETPNRKSLPNEMALKKDMKKLLDA